MYKRLIFALVAFLSPFTLSAQPKAQFLGAFVWRVTDPDFGGFSGLEVGRDGQSFYALTDSATLYSGTLTRDVTGAVSAASVSSKRPLTSSRGKALKHNEGDAEGLALLNATQAYVSFERVHRVAKLDLETGATKELPKAEAFKSMQQNSSLEALAIDAAGNLYSMPERSGKLSKPFSVYRFDGKKWANFGVIPRLEEYLVVGADFGPDGKLYVLERWFTGIGFSSRVMRYDQGATGFEKPVELLRSPNGMHDNLEGISVWEDAAGIHLTMISDDNFKFFQRTEFVDYLVPNEPA